MLDGWLSFIADPRGCEHDWRPFGYEDGHNIGEFPNDKLIKRIYFYCPKCMLWTYAEMEWSGFQLEGWFERPFKWKNTSSHGYSIDGGKTYEPDRPHVPADFRATTLDNITWSIIHLFSGGYYVNEYDGLAD